MTHDSQLDKTDRALLKALSVNARASGSQLAGELGIAESTVSLRLKRLQRSGDITGFYADIDLAVLGAPIQAVIAIQLTQHDRSDIEAFRREVTSWPGVLSLFHLGGRDDYLLHVAARSTTELRDFVVKYVTGHAVVAHSETNIVFEHVKGTGWQELLD